MEVPNNWVILKITTPKETVYKVLAGWSGSYLYGSSWRLNSGIKEMHFNKEEKAYEARGYSGSVYLLHPSNEGHRMATVGVLENLQEKLKDKKDVSIEEITLKQYLKETKNE